MEFRRWNVFDSPESTHKYTKAGKYTVSLTVKNAAGSNTATKSNYVNVVTVTKPVAAFSASPTSGKVPLTVKFTDKSAKSPTSGNGVSEMERIRQPQNPTHKYTKQENTR